METVLISLWFLWRCECDWQWRRIATSTFFALFPPQILFQPIIATTLLRKFLTYIYVELILRFWVCMHGFNCFLSSTSSFLWEEKRNKWFSSNILNLKMGFIWEGAGLELLDTNFFLPSSFSFFLFSFFFFIFLENKKRIDMNTDVSFLALDECRVDPSTVVRQQ